MTYHTYYINALDSPYALKRSMVKPYVGWVGYLIHTRYKGTTITPNMSKDMEVYMYTDFAGSYDCIYIKSRDTARSRHGYIVM